MKLSAMSVEDLLQLRAALASISQAAEIIQSLTSEGEVVSISLIPGQAVIITGPKILSSDIGQSVGDALYPVQIFPEIGEHEMPVALTDGTAAGGRGDTPARGSKPAAIARCVVPKEGPMSEAEKATIRQMMKDGKPRREIADRLGRRLQTISLYMSRHLQAKAESAPPAPRSSSPAAGGAVTSRVAPQAPKERAVTGPARAVASGIPLPDAATSDNLPRRRREIRSALSEVPDRDGFDPELDLALVEGLYKGIKVAQLALDFRVDAQQLLKRFREVEGAARGNRDIMPIEDQTYLLEELRARAAAQRGQAA